MNSSLIGRNAHGIGGRYASRCCSVGYANNLPRGRPPSRRGGATTTTSSSSSSPPPPPPPAAAAAGVGSVLTFLSPSPARSRRAVEFLDGLFRLPRIITTTGGGGGRRDRHHHQGHAGRASLRIAAAIVVVVVVALFVGFGRVRVSDERYDPSLPVDIIIIIIIGAARRLPR